MDLRIKIKEIPTAGAPLARRMDLPQALIADALSGTDGDVDASKLEVAVELTRDHDEIFGRGRLRGVLVLPCARCLEPARVPVDAQLDLQFSRDSSDEPSAKPNAETDVDDLDKPDAFMHDGHVISLEEPLRELIIAELPISALCRQDCAGLCPVCGADRNTSEGRACGHEQAASDPTTRRGLAGLADLKLPS